MDRKVPSDPFVRHKVLTKDDQYVYVLGNKNSDCFKQIVKKINSSTLKKLEREVLGKANEKFK